MKHLTVLVEQAGGSVDQLLSMSGLERIPVIGAGERIRQETETLVMLQSAIELTKDLC